MVLMTQHCTQRPCCCVGDRAVVWVSSDADDTAGAHSAVDSAGNDIHVKADDATDVQLLLAFLPQLCGIDMCVLIFDIQ